MTEQQLRKLDATLALIGSALTVVLVVRMLAPDLPRRLQMRGCLIVSHAAKRVADTSVTIAAHSDTAYHRLTNVTV